MRYTFKLLVAFPLVLTAPQAWANLIVNGSFETPTVPNGSFTNFPGGSTAITGWTVVGVDSAVTDSDFMQSGITFQAQDGEQWIDLAGVTSNNPNSGVTQDISTSLGGLYELSFYVGSAQASPFFCRRHSRFEHQWWSASSVSQPDRAVEYAELAAIHRAFCRHRRRDKSHVLQWKREQQLSERSRQRGRRRDTRTIHGSPACPGRCYDFKSLAEEACFATQIVLWRQNSPLIRCTVHSGRQ